MDLVVQSCCLVLIQHLEAKRNIFAISQLLEDKILDHCELAFGVFKTSI